MKTPKSDRAWIYVAGPYTNPDPVVNTRRACLAGNQLWAAGFMPIVPHLNIAWQFCFPQEEDHWYEYDFYLLRRCDGLLRIPGHSVGADREIIVAKESGIPVYTSVPEVAANASPMAAPLDSTV